MINPSDLTEVEFTFRCRMATYKPEEIIKVHTTLRLSLEEELKKCIMNMALISPTESRMEEVT